MNSVASVLAVLFIGLKLTNYIAWPWLWVLAPVWIPAILVVVVSLAGLIVAAFIHH